MVSEELFANALGISDPWYVKRVNFKGADRLLMAEIDFRPGSRFAVDGVEGEHPARDTETKICQHLQFFQYACQLVPVRGACASCATARWDSGPDQSTVGWETGRPHPVSKGE